jgi:hypothetical protein
VFVIESKGAALEFDGPCSGRQVHGSVFFFGGHNQVDDVIQSFYSLADLYIIAMGQFEHHFSWVSHREMEQLLPWLHGYWTSTSAPSTSAQIQLGHFSKFIHPGSVHLDSEVLRSGAVKGGTKKVVLVLVKSGKPPLAMCFFMMFWRCSGLIG